MTIEDELEAVRQELAALNALLVGLGAELSSTRVETAVRVEGLRAETNRERRLRVIALSAGGFFIFAASAESSEYCSPGARIQEAIDAQSRGVKSQKALKAIYDHPSHATVCDVSFPLRSHSSEVFPTTANLLGFAVLGITALMTAGYHRYLTAKDFRRVQAAAMTENAAHKSKHAITL